MVPSHVSTRRGLFTMMVSCNVGSRPKCGKEKVLAQAVLQALRGNGCPCLIQGLLSPAMGKR